MRAARSAVASRREPAGLSAEAPALAAPALAALVWVPALVLRSVPVLVAEKALVRGLG